MAIQGLVNVEMENYDHFLKMTFPYNKYHTNIHYLIRRISHGLRFKSFPSSWKGLQSFVPLQFTCVHVASENMLMITVLKSLRCFLYGNAKAESLSGTVIFKDSLTEFCQRTRLQVPSPSFI